MATATLPDSRRQRRSAGWAPALAGRFAPGSLAIAMAVIVGTGLLGGLALVAQVWDAPLQIKLGRFTETATMGLVVLVAVFFADEAVDRGSPRLLAYPLAVAFGAAIGSVIGWEVRLAVGLLPMVPPGEVRLSHFAVLHRLDLATIGILVGGLSTSVHVSRRTAIAARRRQHQAERARADAARQQLESALQALQARVEPLFLFETLRRVRDLYRHDAAGAGAVLEDLIVYLRAALPHLRDSSSTVAQEITLVRAWLDIVGRGAALWKVSCSVAAPAADLPLPALVVLPLAQHAVASLADAQAPFDLRIAVRVEEARLVIALHGSTAAFAAGIADRPALDAVAERLRALYGGQASFELGQRPDGSTAVVSVPLLTPDRDEKGMP